MKRNFGHGSTDNQAGRSQRKGSPLLGWLGAILIGGSLIAGMVFLFWWIDVLLTECKPCASELHNGEFEAGYQRMAGSVCLPCRIATTEEEFKVCPPEYREAYLAKLKKAWEWEKTHLHNPKGKK